MIDIQNYKDKKLKGLINIQKIDTENMAIGTKQFSAEDGVELPMNVTGVTLKEVDEAIKVKLAEIADLKAFRVDLVAAV